jgi:hypothetical protein
MSERTHNISKSRSSWKAAAIAAGLLLTALAAVGCGGQTETAVCPGSPEHIVLVPSTSETDYDVSVEMTPAVSEQVVRRVAESCGRLTVGIQDGRPAANLVLHSRTLVPDAGDKEAYNPGAETDDLIEEGTEFAEEKLIDPLEATEATGGSPFFSTLIKIGEEEDAQHWPPATIVLVGDGLVVQRPPEGGEFIRFGVDPVSPQTLAAFVPLLRSIEGSCVLLVGAGATSKLPEQHLRASHQLLAETIEQAGADFTSTRSPEVPEDC